MNDEVSSGEKFAMPTNLTLYLPLAGSQMTWYRGYADFAE